MKFIKGLNRIFKKSDKPKEIVIPVSHMINEQFAENEHDRNRIEKEQRLTEYLAEENKRKKAVEEKLYAELQEKKKTNWMETTNEFTDLKKIQQEHQNTECRITEEQRKLEEYNAFVKMVEESQTAGTNFVEQIETTYSKSNIDTQFIDRNEVNITNLGEERLRFDKFQGKLGYTRKKSR
jgi:hypothetical protein